jgi:beta-lactamase regulating signal transducer with metallopeptidase domain
MADALTDHWLVQAAATAILASLWQGAAIAAGAAVVLRVLRQAAPNRRYLVACLALALLATSWTAAFVNASGPAPQMHTRVAVIRTTASLPASALDATLPAVSDAAPPTGPATPWASRAKSWAVAFVPIWLLGVCFFSTRLAFAWAQVRRVRRSTIDVLPEDVTSRVARIVDRVQVSRPVRLVQSTAVHVPMVVGWLRPLVLLPASALAGLSPAQLDAVIAHELAHIRRHDYLVNLLQNAVEVILFYHPACWWLSRQIRDERELCCDDIAVAACGDRRVYAAALTQLEVLRPDTALSLAATDGPLLRRVRRLVRPPRQAPAPSWTAMAIPAITIVAALAATAGVGAREPLRSLHARTIVQLRTMVPGLLRETMTPGLLRETRPTDVGRVWPKADPPQQSATPTAARVIPSDSGVIEGEVTDAFSRRPIAGAAVDLVGPKRQFHVTTDPAGRFEAALLEPGQYRVYVKAAGYLDTAYGARDVNDIGLLVDVAGGQVTGHVDVALQGAGAVSGRIVDQRGEGIAGVEVELLTQMAMPGVDRAAAVAFAQSEEGGVFRFAQVTPGDYWLRAYAGSSPPAPQQVLATQRCRTSPETCNVVTRGTFYPGVAHLEEAQLLHVDAGGELFGNDFALLQGTYHKVTGRLVAPGGDVSGTEVHLLGNGTGGGSSADVIPARPQPDGRFEFPKVAQGEYLLTAFDRAHPAQYATTMERITVDEADVTDLQIVGRVGAYVQGRVLADPTATTKLAPGGIQVMLQFAGEGGSMRTLGGPPVAADGSFGVEVPSGTLWLRVDRLPPGWMVRRVVADGAEVENNTPLAIADGGRARVDVVLTDRLTHVSGRVTDRRGRVVPAASVLIFPVQPEAWTSASDAVRLLRARQDGGFDVDGLPASEYFAADATALPMYARSDRAALDRLSASAARFRVRDGERVTVRVAAAEQQK